MKITLKEKLQVMDDATGSYQEAGEVVVSFVGKKGLKAIKGLQDVIFKTFKDTAGDSNEKGGKQEGKDVSVDDMLSMLEMTGNSEGVFDAVMESMKQFAKIGTAKLDSELQEKMDIEDLEKLSSEVLRNFLLPKIIQRMNSMSR